jgi:hypothetical protein
MLTRRQMEGVIVVFLLLQPVVAAGKVWFRKHQVTSNNPATVAVAEVGEAIL